MRLLHTSDLHGSYRHLLVLTEPFDAWVDTGDFLPNRGRVERTGFRIDEHQERAFQLKWLSYRDLARRLRDWLAGRPLLSVPGNHDFVPLARILRSSGANAHEVGPAGVEVLGRRWSGFREVPWIAGEWPGETRDFAELVATSLAARPDVLLTHAPPRGVLDGATYEGIPGLVEAFVHHRPSLHLFGHEHASGGQELHLDGTRFVNGATRTRLLDLA